MSAFCSRMDRPLKCPNLYPLKREQVLMFFKGVCVCLHLGYELRAFNSDYKCVCVCVCLLFSIGTSELTVYAYTVWRRCCHLKWVCVYVCFAMYVCVRTHTHTCCRLLERITSFKEYEIQHLLKSDTLWHRFEAMKVRLERHGSSFLCTESWVYVIGLRPVKFPLKRHAPEGETKLPLKAFSLVSFFKIYIYI